MKNLVLIIIIAFSSPFLAEAAQVTQGKIIVTQTGRVDADHDPIGTLEIQFGGEEAAYITSRHGDLIFGDTMTCGNECVSVSSLFGTVQKQVSGASQSFPASISISHKSSFMDITITGPGAKVLYESMRNTPELKGDGAYWKGDVLSLGSGLNLMCRDQPSPEEYRCIQKVNYDGDNLLSRLIVH